MCIREGKGMIHMAHVLENGRQFDNFMFNIGANTLCDENQYLCELVWAYLKCKFVCLNLRIRNYNTQLLYQTEVHVYRYNSPLVYLKCYLFLI